MRRALMPNVLTAFVLSGFAITANAQETPIWGMTPKSSVQIISYQTHSVIHIRKTPASAETMTWLCIGSISERTMPSLPTHANYSCNGFVSVGDNKSRDHADLLLAAKAAESYHLLEKLLGRVEVIEAKINENTASNDKTRTSIEQVNKTFMEQLQKAITKRFDTLPAEILNDPDFKSEIEKLRNDILEEVKKLTDGN